MTSRLEENFGEPEFEQALGARFAERSREVLRLAAALCSIPGVSVPAEHSDLAALQRSCALVSDYARSRGLRVYQRPAGTESPYPYLLVSFNENHLEAAEFTEAVALIGHLDVVPASGDRQFTPFLRDKDLYARGAADMKTVVATFLYWMGELQQRPGPKPPFVLLLSCCEENGSAAPHNTGTVVRWLHEELGVALRFAVVGERSGELEWMGERLEVGPICTENRSWRWFRAEHPSAGGLAELQRIARAVAHCRRTFVQLNAELESKAVSLRQPGLRSGFVNPFTFIAGDERVADHAAAVALTVSRARGSAVHSAVAAVTRPALVESFLTIAEEAAAIPGVTDRLLAGVEIGQYGNFNSYDGSGLMRLMLCGANLQTVNSWIAGRHDPDILLDVGRREYQPRSGPTVVGIDIRELLDHAGAVRSLLAALPDRLYGEESFTKVNDCPPWRCPADQPDLLRLRAAYAAVIGEPSPDPVKLHGNDGGSLVAWQQSRLERLADEDQGHAVVFGQVGKGPHGPREFHRGTSIRPYLEILDRWGAAYLQEC